MRTTIVIPFILKVHIVLIRHSSLFHVHWVGPIHHENKRFVYHATKEIIRLTSAQQNAHHVHKVITVMIQPEYQSSATLVIEIELSISVKCFLVVGFYSGFRQTKCTNCTSGYYTAKNGSTYCIVCPHGHRCPDPTILPDPCPAGTANDKSEQVACTPCGKGNYSVTSGSLVCNPCPAGHQCPNSAELPVKCSPGKYSQIGQVVCTDCDQGYHALKEGSTFCTICGAGK